MNKMHKKQGGFVMLIFVIVTSLSLITLIINYAQFQELSMGESRMFVNNERSIRTGFMCVRVLNNIFSKEPKISDADIVRLKKYKIKGFEELGRRVEYYCEITDVGRCLSDCDYRAIVKSKYNLDWQNTFYIEWKVGEYRVLIKKLIFIKDSVNSLEFL